LSNPALPLQALPHNKNTKTLSIPKARYEPSKENMEDPPLIRYVNQLLQQAAYKRASDIHFESQEKKLTNPIPYRWHNLPAAFASSYII